MATKEAWNYCKALCKARKLKAPTLRTFKWHLKHGNLIKAGQEPNPFGGAGPDKVYAITCEAVIGFVDELERHPNSLDVEKKPVRTSIPPSTQKDQRSEPDSDDRELSSQEAFAYLHRNVKGRSELNAATFDLYLTYDVISSRLDGTQRLVRVGDLDAFLGLAPDGVYANHIDHVVAPTRGPGDLSLKQAYDYYRDVDPKPVTMSVFRSIVAAGILPPIRTANSATAPIVGIRRHDLNVFLATRQRLQEEIERQKEDKKHASNAAVIAEIIEAGLKRAEPELKKARETAERKKAAEPKAKKKKTSTSKKTKTKVPAKPEPSKSAPSQAPRWVPTKKAYVYYEERAKRPYTDSWFRDKVYRSDLFRTKVETDERPNNPSGKKYLVDLNSIDEYLQTDPKKKPKPQKAWPVETAYHKFADVIPVGLSLLQFKRLVNSGMIRSFTRSSVVHVRLDAVESYFEGLAETDPDTELKLGNAYDYYCSRCSDPVTKSRFVRWVSEGSLEGGAKNDEGVWVLAIGDIDAFLDDHPSGRMRANKTQKNKPRKQAIPASEAPKKPGTQPAPAGGSISISLSDYDSPVEMKKALDMLTSQGFEVVVKP